MSNELIAVIDNAVYLLGEALPAYEQGKLTNVEELYGLTTMYRSIGVAELLLRGMPGPFFVRQMQSASIFAFGLPGQAEDDKTTALAAPFWDAVAATYWEAARQIARASRMSHNPRREHEDDFLYVAFLMQRFFLAPRPDASDEECTVHEAAQLQRLERWGEVLEGGLDSRLLLCHALLDQDAEAFAEALLAMSDARSEDLNERGKKGRLSKEELAWLRPIWPQGLALLRLAERDGLVLEDGLEVSGVQPVIRMDAPYIYHADAWRSIGFQPRRQV